MICRSCQHPISDVFVDLGTAPPSNAFLATDRLQEAEVYYPLKLFTCHHCWLVQVDEVKSHADLFAADYVYYSSFSPSWLAHARTYVEHATDRLALHKGSLVVEIASNDGYLLQYVVEKGIPCFGVEPTQGTADVARSKDVETISAFFGESLAQQLVKARGHADLIIGNNVFAHVPDLIDFIKGLGTLLAPEGTITLEFPHLHELVRNTQFDTIYHEHFSYFSLESASYALRSQGLRVYDVEQLGTHGGSLRLWICHESASIATCSSVSRIRQLEADVGISTAEYYRPFARHVEEVKDNFLRMLLDERQKGHRLVAYGAAAKGNTLINYAGVRQDLIPYVVDASTYKQGMYLPGSRIPVVDESVIARDKPDVILILPWNLRAEIENQLSYAEEWGARFVTVVPHVEFSV